MIAVYPILHDWPALEAIVGTRIYRGNAGSDPAAPYVVWRVLTGVPDNHLSGPPPSDRFTVRVDCFADTEAGSDALFAACRDALEQAGQVQSFQDLGEEDETHLWRYTIDADIFRNR